MKKKELDPNVQRRRALRILGKRKDCLVICIGKEGSSALGHIAPIEMMAVFSSVFRELGKRLKQTKPRYLSQQIAFQLREYLEAEGVHKARDAWNICHPQKF